MGCMKSQNSSNTLRTLRAAVPKFSIMMNSLKKLSLSCMTRCLGPSSVFYIMTFKLPTISNRSEGTTREPLTHPIFLNPLVRSGTIFKLPTIIEITHLERLKSSFPNSYKDVMRMRAGKHLTIQKNEPNMR